MKKQTSSNERRKRPFLVCTSCNESLIKMQFQWNNVPENKLESRLQGEISITSDMQMTPPLWQKVKGTQKPLDESGASPLESGE